jgi:hypothetical protein
VPLYSGTPHLSCKLDVILVGKELFDFKHSDQYGALSDFFSSYSRKMRLEISFKIPFSEPFLEKLHHSIFFKNE